MLRFNWKEPSVVIQKSHRTEVTLDLWWRGK